MTNIFYWPSVLFREKQLLDTMRLLRYMIFILEKKEKKNYFAMFLTLIIYLLYVMTPLVAKLAILKYCISYHHQ